ncbi:alpha/beta-hydrolase [Coniochaeta ligniaria NRRL 30616]|uniref:Alpha/beta-hydrolase n=1 Tax=Coniochaeta ligniaria NRRL 30616 TaxID=1408157 RepID=A0A1J7IDH9_9PEZI|nr:alpha/beta-hydrolase [Coniochaeta ligniaria NRRL 30616]
MASFQKITLPDGRALAYSLSAEPSSESPIVLLANSLCADATSWDKVVPVLQAAGFRTLRYDQPGHGASGVPADLASTTFDSIADDVRVLLESLDISKIHAWVGVSMGAATGVVFVTKFPGLVSRLVVCDTITCSPVNEGATDLFGPRVAAARKEGSMDSIIQGTLTRWFGDEWMKSNPEETSRMQTLMRSTTVDGFEACCAALRSPTFDLRPLFAKVASGVDDALLVVGSKDANLPQTMDTMRERIEEGFQNAGKTRKVLLKVIPDAGHVCYIDGLERFCEAVVPFLEAKSS